MRMLEWFDHLYIINLADRTDRRRDMEAELRAVGISAASANVTFFPGIRPSEPTGFPTVGARGSFLSHLAVLREARSRGHHSFLVTEDDLSFAHDFAERSQRAIDGLSDAKWSIFYGGHRFPPGSTPTCGDRNGLVEVDPATPLECAHFMGFQGTAADEIITFFEGLLSRKPGDPRGGPMFVDGAYNTYRLNRKAPALAAIPELGFQRASRSDCHDLPWQDRMPIVSTATSLFRRARNMLR